MTRFWILNQLPDVLREPADGRKPGGNIPDTITWTAGKAGDALEIPEISPAMVEIIPNTDYFADPLKWEAIVLGLFTRIPPAWAKIFWNGPYIARLQAVIDYYASNTQELQYPGTHRIMWELNDWGILWSIARFLKDEFDAKAVELTDAWEIQVTDWAWIDVESQKAIHAISPNRRNVKIFISRIILWLITSFIENWPISQSQEMDYRTIADLAKIVWIDAGFLRYFHVDKWDSESYRATLKTRWILELEGEEKIKLARSIAIEVYWEKSSW